MTPDELGAMMRGRRHSGYWMASCPVHGAGGRDRNPSVSIKAGRNGVSVRCFAGCSTRDILGSIGLTFRDLGFQSEPEWKQRLKKCAIRPAGAKKPLGALEATYRYTDAHGELFAEKLRFEGKVFLWRRPQAGGGWIWKVDRESLPLYRLHQVVTRPIVCLVEGEKDADNLAAIVRENVAVTTAPNGAKSWKPEFAAVMRGKKVWIIPDSDRPGVAYARNAGGQIMRVAQLMGVISVSPSKDISDFLERHSVDDLRSMFEGFKGLGRRK